MKFEMRVLKDCLILQMSIYVLHDMLMNGNVVKIIDPRRYADILYERAI